MQRYFGQIIDSTILLADDDIFHLTRVMRARVGEQIEVVSAEKVYRCEVKNVKPLEIKIVEEIKENHELPAHVVLIAALIKGEKMDFVLQKATEIGADEIVLLQSERCVVKIKQSDKNAKLDRYRRILKEAAEQSKRSHIPTLYRIINFNELKDVSADVKMIAYEADNGSTKSFIDAIKTIKNKQRVAVIVGPEGGFSEKEVELAEKNGYTRVSLGRRILRAETASLYALSVIANYLDRK